MSCCLLEQQTIAYVKANMNRGSCCLTIKYTKALPHKIQTFQKSVVIEDNMLRVNYYKSVLALQYEDEVFVSNVWFAGVLLWGLLVYVLWSGHINIDNRVDL